VFALLAVGLLFAVGSAEGASGALDPSFGVSGMVTTSAGNASDATALLLQSDGKLVAVGESVESGSPSYEQLSLARYLPNGSLDSSFGSGGIVETTIDPGGIDNGSWPAAALQPDGKIVVATSHFTPPSGEAFALVRYNPDGSLDTGFGTGGIVTTAVGDINCQALGVAIQPDGKIVAAGGFDSSSSSGNALVRYLPDGALDTGFGTGGIVRDTRAGEHGFDAVALQPDGKILAVGRGATLTRFNADGSLDATLGPWGGALALQPDGKIVLVGLVSSMVSVTRVNPDGSGDDQSFGNGGTVETAVPGGMDAGSRPAVALQSDGKILVAGGSQNGITLIRYDGNGSLDSTFGSGGIVTTPGASANAVAVQSDGRIDVAGDAMLSGGTLDFALARYLGSSLTITRSGSGTGTVSSSPTGISCGTLCSAPFAAVPVTLTATPAVHSVFAGWSGGGCSGTGTCRVQMSSDQAVTATFSLVTETLTVSNAGSGTGSVTSSPAGIDCGTTCSHAYSYGTAANLTAAPNSGSTFKGWSGACSGAGTCTVSMSQAQSVTATFSLKPACVVPKLKGKSLKIARQRITRAHCRIGKIRRTYAKTRKGRVISQKPRPARHLRNEARVNLVISKGRRP
jgi:uncharacterized delta-60 repeat protein